MADLAQYLWNTAPRYLQAEGEVTIEGDYVRVVATLDWTAWLPMRGATRPIWLALPRADYDAADTFLTGEGNPPLVAEGWGTYIWAYGVEETVYDPFIGYVGRLTLNGEEGVMELIRGDCWLFLTVGDAGPSGREWSGDMDIRWLNATGFAESHIPGVVQAGAAVGGHVRSSRRRVRG